MAPEKGAPLLKSPTSTGMVEHEQNGSDRTERRAQNRVGQLVRARQDALDTLLRHPYLQQSHEEADGDEEQEELSEQVGERAQNVEQVLHGE